jgi:septal ring factor EnvC (AmiA/AmiB activator)
LNAEKAALAKDKAALTAARDEQAKLAQARQTEIDTLKSRLQEQQKRVTELESQIAERDQRQSLMDEELHKAEGQIELIKDLLLRNELDQ